MAIAVRTAQNTEHRGTHAPTVAETKQRWGSAGKADSWDSAGVDQFDRSANVPRCRAPPAKMGYQDAPLPADDGSRAHAAPGLEAVCA